MNPFIQQVIGTFLRTFLVWLSGWLVAHNLQGFSDTQITSIIAYLAPMVVALAWSLFQKWVGRKKLLTALGSPIKMSEQQLERVVSTGGTPSVTTAKTEVPQLPL